MEWFARPLATLWNLFCHGTTDYDIIHLDIRESSVRKERRFGKKPFYSHIPTVCIRNYQQWIDRAFALSPSLDFVQGDSRYRRLLTEAADDENLSALDFELMRIQYVLADPIERENHKKHWALKVVNQKENDFFPSPWSILASAFAHTGNRDQAHEKQKRAYHCS